MARQFPKFSQALVQDPSTRRIWYGIATSHDLENHDGMTEDNLYNKIFASHFGHLAIIFLWTSGNLFHVAWQGNFEQWILNPLKLKPIAHAIWDPHFGEPALKAFTPNSSAYPVNISYSGLYHWWYTIGMRTNNDLYTGSIFLLFLAGLLMFGGWLHLQPKFKTNLSWFRKTELGFVHHVAVLIGVSSLAWAGHLVHVAIPESRGIHIGWDNFLIIPPHPAGLKPLLSGDFLVYANNPDTQQHIFGTTQDAGIALLTFLGSINKQTQALLLTDIAHHHLAIGIIFIAAGFLLRTKFSMGDRLKENLNAHLPWKFKISLLSDQLTLYDMLSTSLHMQLSFALSFLGIVTSLTAQHMYALPSYVYIAKDYTTQSALYTHHQYIAGFLMVGAFAHGAIFLVRDYHPKRYKKYNVSADSNSNTQNLIKSNIIERLLENKETIISYLSWVSLFLGFHTLGLYVHNDTVVAFGQPEKQILIEPIFAQSIQSASGKLFNGFNFLLAVLYRTPTFSTNIWFPGWIKEIDHDSNSSLFLTIGPGDLLIHHAIALGLHTTTLILVKGALDARGSKLMPDKKDFGYSFPCDGPGRGGTCDISAWDAFYLAMFWMLNTIGWVTFYWHWKHLTIWGGNPAQFDESSNYIMGWLRDYLWLNSSPLINGYNPFGMNAQAVWAWMFLFGHLVWATGFMFLISWRGYWQELIETLIWAHEFTPLANLFRWRNKPVALSIVQARLVGLVHFAVGYILTYAAFLIASTSGKFG